MSTRLFVSEPLGNGVEIELHGEQARYLGRVLRARVYDSLCVFNGNDGEWSATIQKMDKAGVVIRVGLQNDTNAESPLKVHLAQGVSRGERMDFVVQKATELGVKRISPLFTQRGVVKLDVRRAERRRAHWQRVAESACEQCGRTRPPLVDAPQPLREWLGQRAAIDSTQLMLRPGAKQTVGDVPPPQFKLCLLIGPEGGFSDQEYEGAASAGFEAVSLGPRVLRTETAAIAALSIVQGLWGDI